MSLEQRTLTDAAVSRAAALEVAEFEAPALVLSAGPRSEAIGAALEPLAQAWTFGPATGEFARSAVSGIGGRSGASVVCFVLLDDPSGLAEVVTVLQSESRAARVRLRIWPVAVGALDADWVEADQWCDEQDPPIDSALAIGPEAPVAQVAPALLDWFGLKADSPGSPLSLLNDASGRSCRWAALGGRTIDVQVDDPAPRPVGDESVAANATEMQHRAEEVVAKIRPSALDIPLARATSTAAQELERVCALNPSRENFNKAFEHLVETGRQTFEDDYLAVELARRNRPLVDSCVAEVVVAGLGDDANALLLAAELIREVQSDEVRTVGDFLDDEVIGAAAQIETSIPKGALARRLGKRQRAVALTGFAAQVTSQIRSRMETSLTQAERAIRHELAERLNVRGDELLEEATAARKAAVEGARIAKLRESVKEAASTWIEPGQVEVSWGSLGAQSRQYLIAKPEVIAELSMRDLDGIVPVADQRANAVRTLNVRVGLPISAVLGAEVQDA